jgi:hypothetical protein
VIIRLSDRLTEGRIVDRITSPLLDPESEVVLIELDD